MELRLRRLSRKQLLPLMSFSALGAAIVIAGLTLNLTPATQTVLLAKANISEGQVITAELVYQANLPIGNAGTNYLSRLQPNLVATTSIAKDALIPKGAIAPASDKRIPIRLNNLPQISKAISVGDTVDVWATAQDLSTPPEVIAFNAIVVQVETNNSMAQTTTTVELRIEVDYLETVLASIDSNYRISLILHETLSDLE